MRKIICLFMLGFALLGYSASADAAGFRGGGAEHAMHSGGFRGGFAEGGHFRGHSGGGGHFRGGIFVGPLFWDPLWWDNPYAYDPYYPVPPLVVNQQAVEYATPEPQPAGSDSWYFCRSSEAYYPYVRTCQDGWLRVAPAPPR